LLGVHDTPRSSTFPLRRFSRVLALDAVFAIYPIKRVEKVNHKDAHFCGGQNDGQMLAVCNNLCGVARRTPVRSPRENVRTAAARLGAAPGGLLCSPARVYRAAKKN
jgi:hypothetical protein